MGVEWGGKAAHVELFEGGELPDAIWQLRQLVLEQQKLLQSASQPSTPKLDGGAASRQEAHT